MLNICFPYTSREEIASAVKATVEEYSTPPRPQNTPFSQTRIKSKVMSNKQQQQQQQQGGLESGNADFPPLGESARDQSPAPSATDDSVSTGTTLHPDSPPFHKAGSSTGGASGSSSSNNLASAGGAGGIAVVQNPESITVATLEQHLYTAGCPPLDLFIRTSGVTRLSDFLLWQCHEDTHIAFTDCYWPEFDLRHFLPILIEWQYRQKEKAREERPRRRNRLEKTHTS